MIVDSIAKLLRDSTAVSTLNTGGVFWGRAPDIASRPYVLVSKVGTEPQYILRGEAGVVITSVDVQAVADTAYDAELLGDAIKAALSHYRGTPKTLRIFDVSMESRASSVASPTDGSDTWRYLDTALFRVTHSEPLPDNQEV